MTALPAIDPSFGTSMSTNVDVDRISYGDGYTVRANPGLNPVQQVWQLQWTNIPDADAETLRLFFDGLAGTGIIDWTPFNQTTALKWTASKFSSKPTGYDSQSCSVILTQEFDL